MLTKKTPDTIKGNLKVIGQGVENSLLLTYHNRSPEEYDAFIKNPENLKTPDGLSDAEAMSHINATLVLFLVKSFDDGTDKDFPLTRAGLMELDKVWPGSLYGIVRGYHQSRATAIEKN
jgi:hypothetical protein